MHIDNQQLQALAQILEDESFAKAANKLNITQSAISQRVQQLEQQLGQRLIIRSTPPIATAAGIQALKYYRQVNHLQSDLIESLANTQANRGTLLSIGSNADSLATWLLDALEPLLAQAHTFIHIKIDDQERTHELLRNGDVIGCISASKQAIKGCNCFPLGVMVYRSLCSPAFIQRYFPNGVTTDAIKEAPCVEFNHKDDLQREYVNRYFSNAYPNLCHRVPSTESFLEFIRLGHGWGMAPDVQSASLLKTGQIRELVPNQTIDVPLYWHIWNLKTRQARELTDALMSKASQVLAPIDE